jgi:hypothetical protein
MVSSRYGRRQGPAEPVRGDTVSLGSWEVETPGEARARSSRTPKTLSVTIRSHVNGVCVVLRLEAPAVSAHSRALDCRRASCVEGLRRLAMGDDLAEGAPAGHLTAVM